MTQLISGRSAVSLKLAAPFRVLPEGNPKANGYGLSGTLGPMSGLNVVHVSSREVI